MSEAETPKQKRAPMTTAQQRAAWAREGAERLARVDAAIAGVFDRIDARKDALGMNWIELGLRMGGHPYSSFHIKQRKNMPTARTLALLADVLACSVDHLLGIERKDEA